MGSKHFLYLIFGGLVIVFVSCSTSSNVNTSGLDKWTTIDGIFAVKSPIEISKKGSNEGILVYQNDTFQYHYSQEHTFGPVTPRQEFMDAFRGNYYYKFFENLHFDDRFHRKFRDSVELIYIDTMACKQQTSLYECKACNACAKLKFKGRYHDFSYIMNSKNTTQLYDFKVDTIDLVEIKNYQNSIDQKDKGIVFTSLRKSKSFLSLWIKPVTDRPNISLAKLQMLVKLVNSDP